MALSGLFEQARYSSAIGVKADIRQAPTRAHPCLNTTSPYLADVDLEAEHFRHFSNVDLLGYGERVINLNSEITDRALDLRVA